MSITDRLEEAIIAARIAARMTSGSQFVTITEEDAVRILDLLKRRWEIPEDSASEED